PSGRVRLLFLAAAENDSLFLSRHRESGMGADLDGATVLLIRDAVYPRVRSGVRIAGARSGTGPIWIDHLQIHGAHPAVRCRVDLYPGDHHHTDPRHTDLDSTSAADVCALRELHLGRMAHEVPRVEASCLLMAAMKQITNTCSA